MPFTKEIRADNPAVQMGTEAHVRIGVRTHEDVHGRGCPPRLEGGFPLKRGKISKQAWGSLLSTPNSDHGTMQLTHSADKKSAANVNEMKPQPKF